MLVVVDVEHRSVHRDVARGLIFGAVPLYAGIGRLVAAAHQVPDDDGLALVGLLDVHRDGAADAASGVVAAKHVGVDAAGDGQVDVA